MTYKVQLEAFSGPMDLLLYLIRQNEVDIYDIPIANIATQFVSYLELMQSLDIEYTAEFLVTAATLMDIKARMLVPQDVAADGVEEEDIIDPRDELVRELLEYKKFHDAALYLTQLSDDRARRYESGATPPELDEKPLEQVEIWDLVTAFAAILKQIGTGPVEINSAEIPVGTYITMILERLAGRKTVVFAQLFDGTSDRVAIVGIFLALLELIRQKRALAYQEANFGEITLVARDGDSAKEAESP
jgi:segregation and condensation protein A